MMLKLMKNCKEEDEERKKKSGGDSVLLPTIDLQNPMIYVLKNRLND